MNIPLYIVSFFYLCKKKQRENETNNIFFVP